LDELAAGCGVRTLSSFGDTRPLPEGVDVQDIDAVEAALDERDETEPWSEWFPAQEGVATTAALIRLFAGTTRLPPLDYPREEVLQGLRELHRCLALAADGGVAFRLEVFP